ENAEFARACEAAGVVFIGPPVPVLERMGDKVAARQTAIDLSIPVIAGTPEPLPDTDAAVAAAASIGYPVILKASFGGGGRGMRLAHHERELREQFGAATREADTARGSGVSPPAQYTDHPRHSDAPLLAA